MIEKNNFVAKLKHLIKANNKHNRDIAADLHLNLATVSAWRTGRYIPRPSSIVKLTNYFNVPGNYFDSSYDTTKNHTDTIAVKEEAKENKIWTVVESDNDLPKENGEYLVVTEDLAGRTTSVDTFVNGALKSGNDIKNVICWANLPNLPANANGSKAYMVTSKNYRYLNALVMKDSNGTASLKDYLAVKAN